MYTLHDVNGPYSRTCSESRKTNAHGQAGRVGSEACIDCFGEDCVSRSFSNRPGANAAKKSHCEERFACPAFDFDNNKCDENFFSTVCHTKDDHITTSSPPPSSSPATYPRRFSDLPGFEFFRNWPHSYADSCPFPWMPTPPPNLTTVKGHPIDATDWRRLYALCQLHKRCAREHPDTNCEPTPDERRLQLVRAQSEQWDAETWWDLPISLVAHNMQLEGVWQVARLRAHA